MCRRAENDTLTTPIRDRVWDARSLLFSEQMCIRLEPSNTGHRMKTSHPKSQNGSAMVLTLFILSILTMVGLLAAKSSTTEMRMAANDMLRKQAFYAAEGVAELVSEIIEENIACPNGFTENRQRGGLVQVITPDFWKNGPPAGLLPTDSDEDGQPVRDMRIPIGNQDDKPHANVLINGHRSFSRGNALHTAAGYEGAGRSLANLGAQIVYDQIVQHTGRFNTEAIVKIQWRHAVGSEGICTP
jgi:hypothetical protein